MSTITTVPTGPLDVAERKLVYFPFSSEVGALAISTATVDVYLTGGEDANPGSLLDGAAILDNVNKIVAIYCKGAGRAGNSYWLRCTATDSLGNTHVVATRLPVVRL